MTKPSTFNLQVIVISLVLLTSGLTTRGQLVDKKAMAEQVRTEFRHSWGGYKQYCWGHDDLKPLSKTCRDWYGGQTILMTPVDALDSLYLLGFKEEADKTRDYIDKNLSFDK